MNTKEIKLKIHEEADLFSDLDPDQMMLSEAVTGYLNYNYMKMHRNHNEQFKLRIISDTPVDEQRVTERIRDYYQQELSNSAFALKRLTTKEICMIVIGVIALSIWLILSANGSNVGIEILSIVGWVAIWEATSIIIMERPELIRVYRTIKNGINAEFVFEIAEKQESGKEMAVQ